MNRRTSRRLARAARPRRGGRPLQATRRPPRCRCARALRFVGCFLRSYEVSPTGQLSARALPPSRFSPSKPVDISSCLQSASLQELTAARKAASLAALAYFLGTVSARPTHTLRAASSSADAARPRATQEKSLTRTHGLKLVTTSLSRRAAAAQAAPQYTSRPRLAEAVMCAPAAPPHAWRPARAPPPAHAAPPAAAAPPFTTTATSLQAQPPSLAAAAQAAQAAPVDVVASPSASSASSEPSLSSAGSDEGAAADALAAAVARLLKVAEAEADSSSSQESAQSDEPASSSSGQPQHAAASRALAVTGASSSSVSLSSLASSPGEFAKAAWRAARVARVVVRPAAAGVSTAAAAAAAAVAAAAAPLVAASAAGSSVAANALAAAARPLAAAAAAGSGVAATGLLRMLDPVVASATAGGSLAGATVASITGFVAGAAAAAASRLGSSRAGASAMRGAAAAAAAAGAAVSSAASSAVSLASSGASSLPSFPPSLSSYPSFSSSPPPPVGECPCEWFVADDDEESRRRGIATGASLTSRALSSLRLPGLAAGLGGGRAGGGPASGGILGSVVGGGGRGVSPGCVTRTFVVQGTDSLSAWRANLAFDPVPFESPSLATAVHRGVYDAARSLYPLLMPLVDEHVAAHGHGRARLAFTGHSLGGSVATLLLLMVAHRRPELIPLLSPVYTFGAPSVLCDPLCGDGGGAWSADVRAARAAATLGVHSAPPPLALLSPLPPHHTHALGAPAGSGAAMLPAPPSPDAQTPPTPPAPPPLPPLPGGILARLGLPSTCVRNVMMHLDIVPRAFACDYSLVQSWLRALGGAAFRDLPGLNTPDGLPASLYAPVGLTFVLQPAPRAAPQHPLLPPGSGLYCLVDAEAPFQDAVAVSWALGGNGGGAASPVFDDADVSLARILAASAAAASSAPPANAQQQQAAAPAPGLAATMAAASARLPAAAAAAGAASIALASASFSTEPAPPQQPPSPQPPPSPTSDAPPPSSSTPPSLASSPPPVARDARAALSALLNNPHPLDMLADPSAYGPGGSVSAHHDPVRYAQALANELRRRREWRRPAAEAARAAAKAAGGAARRAARLFGDIFGKTGEGGERA